MKSRKMMMAVLVTAVFILFTVLIRVVDVQPIGPAESEVGLAALNQGAQRAIGTNPGWEHISEILGIIGILTGCAMVLLGLWQWISRKSLKKVDQGFFVLGALYAVMIICWKGFDWLAINYRPLLVNNVLEPSYPSTHTMLAIIFFGSAIPFIVTYTGHKTLRNLMVILAVCAMVMTVLSRLLAGVHWLTDIVGSILLSAAMLLWFSVALDRIKKERLRSPMTTPMSEHRSGTS
ncbi:MAG: phosphatase PAP2 family protein [Lachnospiraceae bacterium]|nr:phosphatase PAP2 family protein [Lachnospiraceae bacterium]